jgi:RNA polymerase sigma-70 factor (ECF subfamily)
MINESEVIKGCVRNDRACQKALFERFYSKMMGVCMRYAKNRDQAKDMCQEGFLKVFNGIKSFAGKGSLEGWVRRIMVNTSIDHLRRNKHDYLIVGTVYANGENRTIDIADDSDDDTILSQINEQEILKAVQKLSPAYRTVFNLFVIEEYSHKEIAEMLDISEGTSKSNLAKAKYNLRKNLIHLINA